MRDVSIIGVGQIPVGEHWNSSLRQMAYEAAQDALSNADIQGIDSLIVGNMLAGELSHQAHLGALIAGFMEWRGVEATRVEAADASGAAALRQGYLAVASGAVDTVMVLGVEKVTDVVGNRRLSIFANTLDAEYEAAMGATPAALAALLMRRYMDEFGLTLENFAGFSVNAHANGALNPNAMFRNRLKVERFPTAPAVAPPVSLFDAAPEGDGAAAVILAPTDHARDMVPSPVRILASAAATDAVALQDRDDMLFLNAANVAAGRAYEQAGITPDDVNIFELHDSFTVMSALALEASGFAARGEGTSLAIDEGIGLNGRLPISTFGGLKARGHAGGATGVYQAVEAVRQLRGEAGDNQVPDPEIAMTQNIGGLGGTAVTHIFGLA